MVERTGEFECLIEGEEAGILLHAPDDSASDNLLPAARLPGVENPVYAAANLPHFGWVAGSKTHASPDLVSIPSRGLLLATDVSVDGLGIPAEEFAPLLLRNLSGVSLPRIGASGIKDFCETGAPAAAEIGLVEEKDLSFFETAAGDPDALGSRALSAGGREWEISTKVRAYSTADVLDAERAESLDLYPERVVLTVEAGAGNLGRLALAAHRERILSRILAGVDFDADRNLPAAPSGSEEAADLLAATYAASNFADGRASLTLYALRESLSGLMGELRPVASWRLGGFEEPNGPVLHRWGFAKVGGGDVLVCGDSVAAGTGAMLGSAPPFGVAEVEGEWPWEQAGLVERVATLNRLGTLR